MAEGIYMRCEPPACGGPQTTVEPIWEALVLLVPQRRGAPVGAPG